MVDSASSAKRKNVMKHSTGQGQKNHLWSALQLLKVGGWIAAADVALDAMRRWFLAENMSKRSNGTESLGPYVCAYIFI